MLLRRLRADRADLARRGRGRRAHRRAVAFDEPVRIVRAGDVVRRGARALTARGVTRRYGSRVALEPTDLDVRAGEIVVLLGPNGAGKSTLLALLAGALPPTAGEVETELAPGAIGWAPQRPAQYRRLSATREPRRSSRGCSASTSRAAAAEALLAEFELPPDGRPSAHLSVGNQQRLNLAIAFLGAPRRAAARRADRVARPAAGARRCGSASRRARDGGAGAVVATHMLDETLAGRPRARAPATARRVLRHAGEYRAVSAVWLLLAKDARVLARSRLLAAGLSSTRC